MKPLLDDLTKRNAPLSDWEKDFIAANLPKLGREEFLAFLEAADLFINLDHLQKQVEECGFKITEKHLHHGDQDRGPMTVCDFILLLKKT